MPAPCVSRPVAAQKLARVDTKRLRGILDDHTQANTYATDATLDGRAADAARGIRQAVYSSRLIVAETGALLDEIDAARALLREVRDHGLADFDPTARRIDLTRRVAAFVGE